MALEVGRGELGLVEAAAHEAAAAGAGAGTGGVAVRAWTCLFARRRSTMRVPYRSRRSTLIAKRDNGVWRLPIHLGGPAETVFFEV